jgi:hypothetical protein
MFDKLLCDWTAMPDLLNAGIAKGFAAYAYPGFAQVYNKAIRKFRRCAAFSAFMAKIKCFKLGLSWSIDQFSQRWRIGS